MQSSGHVVLLGDSIFANAAYTRGEPDVVTHLRNLLPAGWRATLAAVDGATIHGFSVQLQRVTDDASHLVIAIGGNDALQNSDLLSMKASSSAQVLQTFADRLASFERGYRAGIGRALALGRQTTVCTIYNGALEPERATIARVALALFNDVILRVAVDAHVDVLELRSVCTDAVDYANPIEPSGEGGRKIARAIGQLLGLVQGGAGPARIWGLG